MVVDCLLPMAKTRQKPDLLQGTLDLLILRTLQWGPQHGHGIGVALRASSDEVLNVDHGSLYPALHRLERQGWVDATWKTSDRNQRAKFYRLTAGGPAAADRRAQPLGAAVGGDRAGARPGVGAAARRDTAPGRPISRGGVDVVAAIAEDGPADPVPAGAGGSRPRRRDPLPSRGGSSGCRRSAACPTTRRPRRGRRAFGNVALAKEDTRAVWVSTRLEQLLQDLRFGGRILTKSPGVSLTATALIALRDRRQHDGLLDRPRRAHQAGARRARDRGSPPSAGSPRTATSKPTPAVRSTRICSEHSTAFNPIAAFDWARLTLTLDSGSYAVRAGIVSPNYFDTLGVRLVKGRGFTAERSGHGQPVRAGRSSSRTTSGRTAFGGADSILGQRGVTVNGQPATVVGVAEADFRGALFAEFADIWVPLDRRVRARLQPNRSGVAVAMIGQLAAGRVAGGSAGRDRDAVGAAVSARTPR